MNLIVAKESEESECFLFVLRALDGELVRGRLKKDFYKPSTNPNAINRLLSFANLHSD